MSAKERLKSFNSQGIDKSAEIRVIDEEIAKICSAEKITEVRRHISELSNENGRISQMTMWKVKQKVCPKTVDPPMAKLDVHGNLVSDPQTLKQLYQETYVHRLRKRNIIADYCEIEPLRNLLFSLRLSLSRTQRSEPWSKSQLWTVLKSLKVGKSSDCMGFVNELFKPGVIGEHLFESLLNIINRTKDQLVIPRQLRITRITSIYKK